MTFILDLILGLLATAAPVALALLPAAGAVACWLDGGAGVAAVCAVLAVPWAMTVLSIARR